MKQEVEDVENLTIFNRIFSTSIEDSDEILEGCDTIRHSKGIFSFSAAREDNWPAYIWIKYTDDESGTPKPDDIIFQAERYFRWSFKEHGYISLGDFQGMTLDKYLPVDVVEKQERRRSIEYDVKTCQELARQLFKQ